MRFNYLRSARPVPIQRLLDVRIPPRLHAALFSLAGAVSVVIGAWTIQHYRFHQALSTEDTYRTRYDETVSELERAHLYLDRVKTLVTLDRTVRRIAVSGRDDAALFAEIADDLPDDAWLTAISHDVNGVVLDGSAKDLEAVSGVIRQLLRAKHLRNPMLSEAALVEKQHRRAVMHYRIHLDAVAP